MKILVNLVNLFNDHRVDGIGQYTLNLLKGLGDIGVLKAYHLIVTRANRDLVGTLFPGAEMTLVPYSPLEPLFVKKKTFLRFLSLDQVQVRQLLRRHPGSVLFHPNNALSIHVSRQIPTVVTVHDLFIHHYPQEFSAVKRRWWFYTYAGIMEKAFHLFVPSDFVKQEIRHYYPRVPENRVTVIHNPVSVDTDACAPYAVPSPYILSVNSLRAHKNQITLLKAFAAIQHLIPHHLVLTGISSDHAAHELHRFMEEHRMNRVHITGYLTDAQRNTLYRKADLFVSPSMHEGFGMTPVEAALFEVPVLTTRCASIPEATMNRLNYYEPADDAQQLAAGILALLGQPPEREELAEIRQEFGRAYDYRNAALRYHECFEKLQSGVYGN